MITDPKITSKPISNKVVARDAHKEMRAKEALINGAAREIAGSAGSHFSDDEVKPSSFR
jgi:hypothetical protein